MIYIIIVVLIALIDRTSKMLIENKFQLGESQTIIENVFSLTRTKNTGVAFGAFQNGGLILIGTSFVLMVVVIYMMYTNKNKLARLGCSFILGGAIGNLYDRVFLNGVTDFIDIPPLSFIFPNFNVADSFIVIGTIIIVIYLLFFAETKKISKDQSKCQNTKIKKIKDNINGE